MLDAGRGGARGTAGGLGAGCGEDTETPIFQWFLELLMIIQFAWCVGRHGGTIIMRHYAKSLGMVSGKKQRRSGHTLLFILSALLLFGSCASGNPKLFVDPSGSDAYSVKGTA